MKSNSDAYHLLGYGIAVGGVVLALVLGLVLPASTVSERWVHVVVVAAIVIGVGALIGLALIVLGGLRGNRHLD